MLVWKAHSWGRAQCSSVSLVHGPPARGLCLGCLNPVAQESHMFVRVLAEGFFFSPPFWLPPCILWKLIPGTELFKSLLQQHLKIWTSLLLSSMCKDLGKNSRSEGGQPGGLQLLAARTHRRPGVRAEMSGASWDRRGEGRGAGSARCQTSGYLENIWVAGFFRFLPDI